MVGSIRDNGKVLFPMTVVADAVIDASSGGAGGSQRAATSALGCGASAATGTNTSIGASDADWTGCKVAVFTDGGWFGTQLRAVLFAERHFRQQRFEPLYWFSLARQLS